MASGGVIPAAGAAKEKPGKYTGAAILASNVFVIVLALIQGWDLRPLLIVYWFQSVTIGFFNFRRMIALKRFSTSGLTMNDHPVPETARGKWSTAIFFAVHYGFFHFVYLFFIVGYVSANAFEDGRDRWEPGTWGVVAIVVAIASFIVSHAFSFRRNVTADLEGKPNLGTMMALPYLRIIPMHLTIILGIGLATTQWALLLFLGLKTLSDYLMHVVEHRVLQKKTRKLP